MKKSVRVRQFGAGGKKQVFPDDIVIPPGGPRHRSRMHRMNPGETARLSLHSRRVSGGAIRRGLRIRRIGLRTQSG